MWSRCCTPPPTTTYCRADDTRQGLGEAEALGNRLHENEPELPTDLRLKVGLAHVSLAERFVTDYQPTPGPVANRLSWALSNVGIIA
ncbi:hypothetical protein ACFL6C_11330 [Myxococcota bacterium]